METVIEQTTINQRIKLLIQQLVKGRQKDFAEKIGVNPATINTIIGQRQTKPSYNVLEKIVEVFPQINVEWLIKGDGQMLKVETTFAPTRSPDNGRFGMYVVAKLQEDLEHERSERKKDRDEKQALLDQNNRLMDNNNMLMDKLFELLGKPSGEPKQRIVYSGFMHVWQNKNLD